MAWQSMGLNLVLMSNELVQEAARMQRFPPDTMVTAAVTFSRCLYAQLVQQAVQAPDSVSAPSQQLPGFKPPDGFPLPATGSPVAEGRGAGHEADGGHGDHVQRQGAGGAWCQPSGAGCLPCEVIRYSAHGT